MNPFMAWVIAFFVSSFLILVPRQQYLSRAKNRDGFLYKFTKNGVVGAFSYLLFFILMQIIKTVLTN